MRMSGVNQNYHHIVEFIAPSWPYLNIKILQPTFKPGDLLYANLGWVEYSWIDPTDPALFVTPVPPGCDPKDFFSLQVEVSGQSLPLSMIEVTRLADPKMQKNIQLCPVPLTRHRVEQPISDAEGWQSKLQGYQDTACLSWDRCHWQHRVPNCEESAWDWESHRSCWKCSQVSFADIRIWVVMLLWTPRMETSSISCATRLRSILTCSSIALLDTCLIVLWWEWLKTGRLFPVALSARTTIVVHHECLLKLGAWW
jgi:hypothetical protein